MVAPELPALGVAGGDAPATLVQSGHGAEVMGYGIWTVVTWVAVVRSAR